MIRFLSMLLFGFVMLESVEAQIETGRFCLEYYPQPLVETYVDSLVSFLSRELGEDQEDMDSTTLDYINHFASLATRESKCVYFDKDSILINEMVDQELTNAYLIIPSENKLLSRELNEIIEQSYYLEPSEDTGYFDYEIKEDRNDTKLIEGFPCYRIEVLERFYAPGETDAREKNYVLYVTNEIKVPGGYVLGINMSRIIGCPLEVQEPLNSKISISYRAKGLRFSLPSGVFESL